MVPTQPNDRVLALLRASLGDLNPKESLKRLFEKAPQCGPFEWMLTILAIEIDLRVDIPEKLADDRKVTAAQFAEKVCRLPQVSGETYTLDCLGLVAQALLHLETDTAEPPPAKRRSPATSTPSKATRPAKPAARAPNKKTPNKKARKKTS